LACAHARHDLLVGRALRGTAWLHLLLDRDEGHHRCLPESLATKRFPSRRRGGRGCGPGNGSRPLIQWSTNDAAVLGPTVLPVMSTPFALTKANTSAPVWNCVLRNLAVAGGSRGSAALPTRGGALPPSPLAPWQLA